MNLIIAEGKVGKDAELKYTPSGTAVLEFSVAVTESYKDKNEKWQKVIEWFNCRWWGKQAESNADHLKKGTPVIVQGKQRTDKWDDKETGSKRSRSYLLCSTVKHFTSFKKTEIAYSSKSEIENNVSSQPNFTADDIPF